MRSGFLEKNGIARPAQRQTPRLPVDGKENQKKEVLIIHGPIDSTIPSEYLKLK